MNAMGEKKSFSDLIAGELPVLVDFYADWCGPCKMMSPVLEELSESAGGKFKVIKINVDRNPNAAAHYGIRGVPTFIIFKNGEAVWRKSGVLSLQELKQEMLSRC
jgi:thioredoxin 1